MKSITLIDLLTLIYVLVNDCYQAKGAHLLKGKPGVKPEFMDSEVITEGFLRECQQEFLSILSSQAYETFVPARAGQMPLEFWTKFGIILHNKCALKRHNQINKNQTSAGFSTYSEV